MNVRIALAKYLAGQGLIDYSETDPEATNSYIGYMPDKPDVAVMLMGTGGVVMDSKLPYRRPSVQIIVRGTRDPRVGHDLAQAIYDKLHGLERVTLDGVYVVGVQMQQSGPIDMGPDAAGRHEFSINLEIEHHQVTANAS